MSPLPSRGSAFGVTVAVVMVGRVLAVARTVAVEAISRGVPVIATGPRSGFCETVEDGATGTIVAPGSEVATGGVYGDEGYVYQLFDPLPEFDGFRPALGAWIVGDEAAGLGIRETVGLVTDDGAAFVPHLIPPAR